MQVEVKDNILYGGDPEVYGPLNGNCASLGEFIIKELRKGGKRTTFINGTTHKATSFNSILEQSVSIARTLYAIGIRKDDVISIVSENRHEYPVIVFGALYLNAIIAPINVTYTERELKHALSLSKPKLVFVSSSQTEKTVAVCKQLNYVKNVISIDETKTDQFVLSLNELIWKHQSSNFNVDESVAAKVNIQDQVAMIFCSSGTTGQPKGVLITQENAMACHQTYRGFLADLEKTHKCSIITLNIAPWFHVLGFMSMFMFACSSQTVFIFLTKFDENVFYKAIEKYKVTFIIVVPPIMVLMAKSPLFDKYDLSSVREISSGAAALSKEVTEKVSERFKNNIVIIQGYGMSETTYGVIGNSEFLKPGSVGQPYRGIYAKVIDENGKALGPNHTGELCVKGTRIMKGYINDPEATKNTIDKDGWLHTGDIAYYDEDKQFYIVDRIKELIKYNALQVPPAEIEGLLLSNPKIKDCGVIGIPDETAGELPFAFIVKQPGVELTEQEVIDYVTKNTSKAKWLRGGVKFIETIPKNPSGKLLRREMREMYKNLKSKL